MAGWQFRRGSTNLARALAEGLTTSGFTALLARIGKAPDAEHVFYTDDFKRQEYVDQAELLRDALGVDPEQVEFTQMNIYDLSKKNLEQDFDLVLLFRVLDHLSNPLSVIQKLGEVTRKYLIVDVRLAAVDQPFL